jgi:hypothetical protein
VAVVTAIVVPATAVNSATVPTVTAAAAIATSIVIIVTNVAVFAAAVAVATAKLPVNRQSETSLGKGEKGGKILTLHVEGFQNLKKHVEDFWNHLKKQLELINK